MTGHDSTKTRDKNIETFKNSKEINVFIVTLKIGSVGLNLQEANFVFIMDPWWNPFTEEQAVGRAHRQGQEREVIAITFITKNSVEERVRELKKIKKEAFQNLFEQSDL